MGNVTARGSSGDDDDGSCSSKSHSTEFRRAAEAIVDAAVVCNSYRGDSASVELSESLRKALVTAICNDPTLTGELFGSPGRDFH